MMGTVQSVTWRVRTSVTARGTRWVTSAMAMGTKGVQRTSSGRFKCPKRLSLKLSVIFVKKNKSVILDLFTKFKRCIKSFELYKLIG